MISNQAFCFSSIILFIRQKSLKD